jgi:hypothetical protein
MVEPRFDADSSTPEQSSARGSGGAESSTRSARLDRGVFADERDGDRDAGRRHDP